MSDRAQLKYVRTEAGFATCPALSGQKQHVLLAGSVLATPISAGFIDWDVDGLPLCMGRSETLNLNSMACDTAALRKAWGMTAPHPAPAVDLDTPGNRNPEARYAGYSGRPLGQFCSDDERRAWTEGAAARELNPAALADARKFGEGLTDKSLEQAL